MTGWNRGFRSGIRTAFVAGVVIGGFLGGWLFATPVELSPGAESQLAALGITDLTGLVPREIFNWSALLTPRTFVSVVVGGFLVGFGTAWAGGCTSGHGITGLANFDKASLLAVLGFFAGGLAATWLLLPLVL